MIVIVDYGMGNVGSIKKMIEFVGGEAIISSKKEDIMNATKLILPGVGSFDHGMKNLNQNNIIRILNEKVIKNKTPILGICLGMQLMAKESEEGTEKGLGWIKAKVIKFEINNSKLKIPHMGWNYIQIQKENDILKNIPQNPRYYFVHSYHMKCDEEKDILTKTKYDIEFTSSIQKNNIYGMQFHPEKSHKFGMKIIENFIKI